VDIRCSAHNWKKPRSPHTRNPSVPQISPPEYLNSALSITPARTLYKCIFPNFLLDSFMAFRIPIRHIRRFQIRSHSNISIYNLEAKCRTRTMSTTTAPEKFDWLVILPDHEGVLAKRMEVRAYVYFLRTFIHVITIYYTNHSTTSITADKANRSHLSAITPLVESGFWKMGGTDLWPMGNSPRVFF
jgi:hypothetical protein